MLQSGNNEIINCKNPVMIIMEIALEFWMVSNSTPFCSRRTLSLKL